jgi:hypothetical protein
VVVVGAAYSQEEDLRRWAVRECLFNELKTCRNIRPFPLLPRSFSQQTSAAQDVKSTLRDATTALRMQ